MHADGEDPWARARDSQRDQVAAVLARPDVPCPSCGTPQREGRRTCARCGAELAVRAPRWRPSRRMVAVALVAVAAIVAVLVPVVSAMRDDASDDRARAAARQERLEARERVRIARESRPIRATGPRRGPGQGALVHRSALLERAEALLLRDARGRVAAGTLEGPIAGARCTPYPNTERRDAAERDPAADRGRYDCVAYKRTFEAPARAGKRRTGYFGYPYWLVIDYRTAGLVWCKVTPRAGEGGRSLAAVPVPAPCREPGTT